jgi:AcrR family transcriptional regulator
MMGHPAFNNADFLNATLALVAEHGPSAVTVAAIAGKLKAPIGSFYHRFASRDVLLAELWLNTVLSFQ